MAAVTFIAAERQWLKSEVGLGVRETLLDQALCRHALFEADTLVIPDTLEDERSRSNPLCTGGPNLRFYAGAAIRTPDGFPLGTVCVLDHRPRQLEPGQREALQTLARQVMNMLELRRQGLEARQIAALRGDISVRLASGDSLPVILQDCAELLVVHLDAAFARVWTLPEGTDVLVLQASAGMYTHLDGPHSRVKVGDFKIGRIAQSRKPHLTNDVRHDPNISDPQWACEQGMIAFAGYPLAIEDRVAGVLAMFFRRTLSEAVLRDLEPIAYSIAQCVKRKHADDALVQSEKTARFLAQVSADLAELTDYQSTLQTIASTSVPAFADWCSIDLPDGKGRVRRLAVTHADPAKVRMVHELSERYPPRMDAPRGVTAVLRTGQAEMAEEISDSLLVGVAQDEGHLQLLRALGLKSYLCVPMSWRGKTLGVLTFATAESGRRYNRRDLMLAADLAHRAAVAVENADLYRDLQQANRLKDEFLATLAHELRNPLAPLRNALTLLQADENVPETVRETHDLMNRQLQQMVRLVDDLLDVSRITRSQIELRREPVLLSNVVQNAVEISRPLIETAAQILTVELPPVPIHLLADLTRLAQVFSNLLNNASKYTEPRGRIWLIAERDGTEVNIRVKDTGIGIRPEMLHRVFDLFAQEDRSLERSQGGLGIGLTLARRLVEMHGGRIEAHSAGLGQGSEFMVRLPTVRAVDEVSPPGAAVRIGPVPASVLPRRVLVVDDNRDATMTLARLLSRRGHQVEVAFDGEDAIAAAAIFQPEIVLMDIGLPKLNGYDAGRRILEQTASGDVVLVALTGWGQENDRRRALQAGFAHHLVKPVDFEALTRILDNAVRSR
ncbi:MAG: GAF domain-containing protein [Verrucomicrobia bacterium]|nr:GAF domain-containing protein [Verrucomicrobiota bacterium]